MRKLLLFTVASAGLMYGQSTGPVVLPASVPDAFVNEFYSVTFSCTSCGSSPTFSLNPQSPIPAGLSFNPATRTLSGTPINPRQRFFFSISISADSSTIASRSYSLTTDNRLAFITGPTLQPATAGIPISRTIQVSMPSNWDNGARTLPTQIAVPIPTNSVSTTISGTFSAVSSPTTYSIQLYASYPPGSDEQAPFISQTVNRTFSITVNPPPTLSLNLPPGTVGVSYVGSVLTNGGSAPFTYSANGNLPPGLALNPQTGQITGVPTVNGPYSFQMIVRDVNGATAAAQASIPVTGSPITITSLTFPAGRVAQTYSVPLTATGGILPYTWLIVPGNTPPPGITVAQTANGAFMSGIPNSLGVFPFTIRVIDAVGTTSQANVSIAINPVLLTITSTTLPLGTPNTPYATTTLAATGGIAPYVWTLASGALPTGMALASNGVISGTPTSSGNFSFGVRVTDTASSQIGYQGGAATRDFTITVGPGVLSIVPPTLPASVVGQAFTSTFSATGGTPPYTWNVLSGSLPAGLTLSTAGVLSGTPTTAGGPTTFTIQVRDNVGGTATRDVSITTIAGLSITTASLDDGVIGVPYSVPLLAANGTPPYTFAVVNGTLPAGITLSDSGLLSGNPTTAANASLIIRVIDSRNLAATRSFTLVVRPPLAISTESLPTGNIGAGYSAQLVATGGFLGYSFAVQTGTLPPGLNLSVDGFLTGTPTTSGAFPLTFRVTDRRNFTAARSYTLNVAQVALPSVTVTQITDTTQPASQPTFGVVLGSSYPAAIDGTVTLAFQPDNGPTDPDVKLSNGSNTMNFTIPAGQTAGVPPTGTPFAFSSGTTAGTITLTVVLRANGQALSPNPAATRTIRVNRAGPTITSVRINRTSAGFDILVTGYSNTREITGGTLRFNPAAGITLAANEFPLNVGAAFQTWFNSSASAAFGTQFLLTIPVTVSDGTASSLSTVLVTLTNAAGSGSALGNF